MKRSNFFASLLMFAVITFGLLAAPFASAGNLVVAQACYATQPEANLTLINTTTAMAALLPVSDKRCSPENATLISTNKLLISLPTAYFLSATYLPAGISAVHRSQISHILYM